jgi:GNAT superfamily N-acetyltransferase
MDCRMLVAALPIAGLRANSSVRVEEVVDRPRMHDALSVQFPDRDASRLASQLEDRMRRLGTDQHFAVAYIDGRPVGTARWRIHRTLRAVEFNGAETLPDFRGQGVYSTLVAFRASHAERSGCVVAGINADTRICAPILLNRGFEDLGPVTFYLWLSSRF